MQRRLLNQLTKLFYNKALQRKLGYRRKNSRSSNFRSPLKQILPTSTLKLKISIWDVYIFLFDLFVFILIWQIWKPKKCSIDIRFVFLCSLFSLNMYTLEKLLSCNILIYLTSSLFTTKSSTNSRVKARLIWK